MKHFADFSPSHLSFKDRIGPPTEFEAAIGNIALGFSYLDDTARNLLLLLTRTSRKTGLTLAAPLSFKQKLEILEALIANELVERPNTEVKEVAGEIFQLCRCAEDLRNTYLHSSYAGIVRVKYSARGKQGLKVAKEPADSDLLMDVADFIVYAAMQIEGLPILLGLATSHVGGPEYSAYFDGEKEIARFLFGESE